MPKEDGKSGNEQARKTGFFRPISRLSRGRVADLYEEIGQISRPTRAFYIMVALSATIASFGLLADSGAVVIGAMLVAPLMGPIFGISLGLLAGSRRLLLRAVPSELIGVALAIGLSFSIGHMPWRMEYGAEIMARTQPTLYDIIVALCAGLAGAYALVNDKISAALPGVAVAVALVPPLCVCGLCLAAGQPQPALGAFLLFVANFLAIQVATAFVFTLSGMVEIPTRDEITLQDFFLRFGISLAVLILIGISMTQTLVSLTAERRLLATLRGTLTEQAKVVPGAEIADVVCRHREGQTDVIAAVDTSHEFTPVQIARMEDALIAETKRGIHLIVRSILTTDRDRDGPVFVPRSQLLAQETIDAETRLLGTITSTVTTSLSEIAGASLVDVQQEKLDGLTRLIATVRTPEPVPPAAVATMQAELQRATKREIMLVVRSVLTSDADAHQYLYAPMKEEPAKLSDEQAAQLQLIEKTLREEVGREVLGASVPTVRTVAAAGAIRVLATCRAQVILSPEQVGRVQTRLREVVDPAIELLVRSELGADVSSAGIVAGIDDQTLEPVFPADITPDGNSNGDKHTTPPPNATVPSGG